MIGKRYDGISLEFALHRLCEDAPQDIWHVVETVLPQSYPTTIKQKPSVYTRARIRNARDNIKAYPWARKQAETSIREADHVLRSPLAKLVSEMPSPNIPRGWQNFCPHCGWWGHGIPGDMDIVTHPWEVGCPACKKMIPGFDARTFFFSGKSEMGWFEWQRADRSLLPKKDPARKTAIDAMYAYCYAYWYHGFCPALEALSNAYVYTGKKTYAKYALGLLTQLAYFFPYHQKRDIVNGDTHPGQMVMDCYEAMIIKVVALAYDKIFLAIPDPALVKEADGLMRPYGMRFRNGREIKTFIEGRIFKHITRNIERIWFMDGGTVRYKDHVGYETIGMILGDTPLGREFQAHALDLRFQGFENDGSATIGGLLYDLPSFIMVMEQHLDLMKYCPDAPIDLMKDPTLLAAGHFNFDMYCLGAFFPNYGDGIYCSSPLNFRQMRGLAAFDKKQFKEDRPPTACLYAELFNTTGIPRFAAIAWEFNGRKANGIHLGILDKDPEKIQDRIQATVAKETAPLERSIIARDIGLCVLKSGKNGNRRALWLRANDRNQTIEGGWHGHTDSMNLGLFGYGLDLLPDVGYMDQKHWIFGHNTVSRQTTPLPHTEHGLPKNWTGSKLPLPILARAEFIAEFPCGVQVARCVGIDHPNSRRTSFLVDVDAKTYYVVDHFFVSDSVPDPYVTYCYHTTQGRTTTDLKLKKHTTHIQGVSRMSGEWLTPTMTASKAQAKQQWWTETKVDDTYDLLNGKCDAKVRFTSLRPADHVFHTHYMPQQKFDGNPNKLPYYFMSLAKPKTPKTPRQFTAVIEPYRKTHPVASARVIDSGRSDVEIIEITETSGRIMTFVIGDGRRKITLDGDSVVTSDVAVIADKGKHRQLCER